MQMLSNWGSPPVYAILILWTTSLGLQAQEVGIPASLVSILQNPQHQKAVVEAAQQSSTWVNNRCENAAFAITGLAIYQPVAVDERAQPIAGTWKQTVTASCGTYRLLNVITSVKAPGALISSVLLPGSTRADPQLQRDAVRYAVIASGGAPPPSCHQAYVADTKFVDVEGQADPNLPPARRSPPWKEEWTMIACERHSIVTLHFVPDATGTLIHAGQRETRQAP
jgi:hypothetical protein